jgi:transcription elongation GreA/GreB family factor
MAKEKKVRRPDRDSDAEALAALEQARGVPEPDDHTEVRFGHIVTIIRDDGREQTYRIVGEDEADPTHGTLSHVSPLARALFGKRIGEVVPAGSGEAKILKIKSNVDDLG